VSRYGLLGAASGAVLASVANHVALYMLPVAGPWIRPCVHSVVPLVGLAGVLLWVGTLVPLSPLAKAVGLATAFAVLAGASGCVGRPDLERLRRALATD